MKRYVAFLLVLITMFVMFSARADDGKAVTFRGIPWLSSETQVIKALKAQGIITDKMDLTLLRRELIQEWFPFEGCEYPNGTPGSSYSGKLSYPRVPQVDYFFRGTLMRSNNKLSPVCQVAGHDAHSIRVVFLPRVIANGTSKAIDTSDPVFVRAGYVFDYLTGGVNETVYEDLQSKLISLYGEPTSMTAAYGTLKSIWHINGEAGIYLWTSSVSPRSVYLDYAYINDEGIVSELSSIQQEIDDDERNSTGGL